MIYCGRGLSGQVQQNGEKHTILLFPTTFGKLYFKVD